MKRIAVNMRIPFRKRDIILPAAAILLIVNVVILPAYRLSGVDSYKKAGSFDKAENVIEENRGFLSDPDRMLRDMYCEQGDYDMEKEYYEYAIDAYAAAKDMGAEVTDKIQEAYLKYGASELEEQNYSDAERIFVSSMDLFGYDFQSQLDEVYYEWGKNLLNTYDYRNAVTYLQKSNGYADAQELLNSLQEQAQSASENGDISTAVNISSAFAGVDNSAFAIARDSLAPYRDRVSMYGKRILAAKADGSVSIYGKDTERFYVGDWSNVSGVYCGSTAAFGWTSEGRVFASGDYQSSTFSEWSDIIQVVGDGSRVYGLRSDGTVLCYTNGVGTETRPESGIVRLAMGTDGRIAMLSQDGCVFEQTSSGEMDSSVTGALDISFAGDQLVVLDQNDNIQTEAWDCTVENGKIIMLYPSENFVSCINTDRKAEGNYYDPDHLSWKPYVTEENCVWTGSGYYWEYDVDNCSAFAYLTESGDLYVYYYYVKVLNYINDTVLIDHIF